MMMLWALLAGILSFLSPCVISIAPGYLSIVSGTSFSELKSGKASQAKVLKSTAAFIAGFTLVFIILGVVTSYFGELFRANRTLIMQIGGVIIILFGLHQAGWLPISWLYKERKVQVGRSVGLLGAFITGMAFSFGWTPCVGPILGSILALASSEGDMIFGLFLLLVYSFGLAIPFALLALFFDKMLRQLNKAKKYMKYIEWFTGAVLILMGILLLTNNLSIISQWFARITGGWNPESLLPQ